MKLPASNQAGLHVRYEKAGLIFDVLPIPWNADAVIVEANVRLPKGAPRAKQDFTLRWSAEEPGLPAELLLAETPKTPMRVFFRVRKPKVTSVASVHWRDHLLGQAEVPIIGMREIVNGFTLEAPTVHVALGERAVACQSFVSTQAKSVFASAIVRSPIQLAPAIDLALRVDVQRANGEHVGNTFIQLTPEEMGKRQTVVTVSLPKLRGVGAYEVSWRVASRCLHTQKIRTVSKKTLLRSLRISTARFQLLFQDETYHYVRTLPMRAGQLNLDGVTSVEPIFCVSSSEQGMAGLVPFTLRALVDNVITTLQVKEDVLVTDGLQRVSLGGLPINELSRVKHFTLATGNTVLGNLPLLPAPKADFTPEGGFAPLDDFLWSAAAEEQLNERLGKLLDET